MIYCIPDYITYVKEDNAIIVLDFRTGEFYILSGLVMKIILVLESNEQDLNYIFQNIEYGQNETEDNVKNELTDLLDLGIIIVKNV